LALAESFMELDQPPRTSCFLTVNLPSWLQSLLLRPSVILILI